MSRSQSAQIRSTPTSSLNPSGRSSVTSERRANAPVSASAALAKKAGTGTALTKGRVSATSSNAGSASGALSSRRSSSSNKDRAVEDEDGEELMSMSLADSDLNQRDAGMEDEEEDQEELIKSPSTRMSVLSPTALKDHMSLLPPSASNANLGNSPRNAAVMGALQREVEELRVKNRLLEKKRDEDREKIREGDKIREEAEEFLKMKNKMGGE